MDISTGELIRISVISFYVPVVFASYWRLIPRLSPSAKRLASGMLAAQVLVIVASLGSQPSSDFERWLWDFHEEWNIPATLASVQLAVVGGLGLVGAWLARGRPALLHVYLVAVGLIFMFLALDEFLALHEFIPDWETRYIALGATVVVATIVVALRSPRRSWLWHFCLLTGLGISAAGALVLNTLPIPCGSMGFLRFDGCLEFFFLEESCELLGIWLALVAILGLFSDAAPMPKPRVGRLLYMLPGLWILVLVLNAFVPRLEIAFLANAASVEFETGIHLHGYHIERRADDYIVRLYASASQQNYMGLGYSIHLVDQVNGDSVASRDEWADRQHGVWLLGPKYVPTYRQWMEVKIALNAPTNRALWVVLTLWRKGDGDFVRQKILASDHKQLHETQVVLGELVLPATSAASSTTVPLAVFDNGFTLETVDLPERAKAGETLSIPLAWISDEDGHEDHTQFLHLGHEESGDWWVYDQQPLGDRLPTRLWYSGLGENEVWQVRLPSDLAPGQYEVFTGLYRTRDRERVSAKDADGQRWLDGRVSLGILMME